MLRVAGHTERCSQVRLACARAADGHDVVRSLGEGHRGQLFDRPLKSRERRLVAGLLLYSLWDA